MRSVDLNKNTFIDDVIKIFEIKLRNSHFLFFSLGNRFIIIFDLCIYNYLFVNSVYYVSLKILIKNIVFFAVNSLLDFMIYGKIYVKGKSN